MSLTLIGGLVLNIYTFVLALMLLIFQENDRKSHSNIAFIKLISILVCLVGVSVLSDIALLVGESWLGVYKFGKFFVFAFDPLGFLFTLSYIDTYAIYGEKKKRQAFIWAFRIYAIFNFTVVLISEIFKLNWFYYVTGMEYHRGSLFVARGIFHVILCFAVMAYVIIFKNDIVKTYRLPIMAFPFIVAVGGFMQVTLIQMNLEYAATVMACLVLLFYVQRRDVNLDYLTGVVNRRGIDLAMKRAIFESKEKEFAAIMIDVDYFKTINDKFGHKAGDEVLECIADVLTESFEEDDVVGRFGGDEFCIITQINDEKELKRKIRNIKDSVASIDWSNKGEIDLSISTGVAVYERNSGMKVKDFLEFIDRRMYKEKMQHHLEERRHNVV